MFGFTLPADNFFGAPAGVYFPTADEGYYVMLEPLSASQMLVATAFLSIAGLPSVTVADNGLMSQIIAPDFVIAGRTYGEWSAAWWQWALSIPASSHPLFDKGDCTTGQSGQVFFLGGKFCVLGDKSCNASLAKRKCTVPRGRNLFFPIVNAEDSVAEEIANGTGLRTINELRTLLQGVIDGTASLEVDLDGKSLKDLSGIRAQSSVFGYTLPDDNLFKASGENVGAGVYFPAVDEGVYVMLQPLLPGSHLLHFTGSFPAFSFSFNITYQLTVSP